jgi:hypothetical protein
MTEMDRKLFLGLPHAYGLGLFLFFVGIFVLQSRFIIFAGLLVAVPLAGWWLVHKGLAERRSLFMYLPSRRYTDAAERQRVGGWLKPYVAAVGFTFLVLVVGEILAASDTPAPLVLVRPIA